VDREIVHVVIVPINANEPGNPRTSMRHPARAIDRDSLRGAPPENSPAELRWLTIADAFELTDDANMRESLPRMGAPGRRLIAQRIACRRSISTPVASHHACTIREARTP